MSLGLYSEKDVPRNKWAELTSNSLFTSPEFISLWNKIGGRALFVVDEADDEFIAGMAGMVFGGGLFRRFESMPRSLPGGIYFSKNISDKQKAISERAIYSELAKGGFLRSVINSDSMTLREFEYTVRKFETHIIELADYEPGKKIAEHLRAAGRRGGEAVDASVDDIDDLYSRSHETASKHGRNNPYGRAFYEALLNLAQTEKRIIILKVLHEGMPAAFRISFMERDRILNWQLYIDPRFKSIKPGFLLMQAVFDIARANEIKYIDMGSSPLDAESLVRYKESWGGKKMSRRYYVRYNIPGKILHGLGWK